MSPAISPPELHVLQALHEDWQTVGALVSEIGAFQKEALRQDEVGTLVVRLCARLYALSRVETELLYPCLDPCAALESGQKMHEQLMGDVQGLLDAVVVQDRFDNSIELLADRARSLRRFEYEEIYPRCVQTDVDAIGKQLAHRRNQLLESFNTE